MRNYRGMTKRGKWVYGWYFHCSTSDTHNIHSLDDSKWPIVTEVLYATIGQQVGLKDKKQKDCYFGDKVKHNNGDIGIIKWHKQKHRVYFEWEDGSNSYPIEHYDYIDFEIIGNITENPELLEKNNDRI